MMEPVITVLPTNCLLITRLSHDRHAMIARLLQTTFTFDLQEALETSQADSFLF